MTWNALVAPGPPPIRSQQCATDPQIIGVAIAVLVFGFGVGFCVTWQVNTVDQGQGYSPHGQVTTSTRKGVAIEPHDPLCMLLKYPKSYGWIWLVDLSS